LEVGREVWKLEEQFEESCGKEVWKRGVKKVVGEERRCFIAEQMVDCNENPIK
jgi:hypothetical protein